MNKNSLFFLFLALACVLIQAFFSMFEMASVSFNKARLTYYTSKKIKNALWLDYLLKSPSRLFGTTLIMVNTMLQVGSEAARRFYESLGLNPDLAAISQVFLVVVFGELAPLFAARKHPERIAMFNVPVIFFISKLLTPFIWIIDRISSLANVIFGQKNTGQLFLTKEEIQKAFEEKDIISKDAEINKTVSNIFSLKNITAKKIMVSLTSNALVPSDFTIDQTKGIIEKYQLPFALIYHHNMNNLVSVVPIRDLLKARGYEFIKNYGQPPWFISENISVLDILKQFRKNNQSVSIILNPEGLPIGVITLDMIIFQIFGSLPSKVEEKKLAKKLKKQIFIEKTLSGDMQVKEFNKQFNATLPEDEESLSDLIYSVLQHHPSIGEVVIIENFEFEVKETTLLGAKTILARSLK